MGEIFLEYLKSFNSPDDILDGMFKDFTERLSDYLDFIRKKDRNEDPKSLEVGRKLRDLGAPMEAYKIMKADAHYYKHNGNEKMFWKQMYLAGAFANLGYPTRSIEKETKNFCEELKNGERFLLFLPLFLNNYACTMHLYRENYSDANGVYRRDETEKADEILEGIIRDASETVRRFIKPSYHRIKALILANKGYEEKSIELMIRSLEDAGYYGNTLAETLMMRDSLNVYNILASHKGMKDIHIFFKEKGLFDYLLKVLRLKDWYLGSEHSENVKKTAVGIAEALSLKRDEIQLIGTSALLHDIGKCAIPWYSLNKIAPLDDLDWEILQVHPTEGGRMLRKLGLDDEAEIAENHHERIDGSGYPEGKKGISLETEIVAVSDAYNAAITPNRRYRVPKIPRDVLNEIKKGERSRFSSPVISGLEKYVKGQFR
jgi:putative nucleotidyltransferase with HDIG domain